MPTVFIPPSLRSLTDGVERVEVAARTLRAAIAELEQRFPGLAERLCQGDRLSPGLAVSVDGHLSTRGLLTRLEPTSEVHFLPAVGGG